MLAVGMLADLAFSIAKRRVKFMVGSAPFRAAIAIALPSLVKSAPLFESVTAFWRLMVAHLECPDILDPCYFATSICYYLTFLEELPNRLKVSYVCFTSSYA